MLVVIAKSDEEAQDLVSTYLQTTGRNIEARLDVRGRVIYVWEGPSGPCQPNARPCTTAGTSDRGGVRPARNPGRYAPTSR